MLPPNDVKQGSRIVGCCGWVSPWIRQAINIEDQQFKSESARTVNPKPLLGRGTPRKRSLTPSLPT